MSLPAEEQHIQVLSAAVDGLDLLVKGLSRGRIPKCPRCQYSPDVVFHHLRHFAELIAAVEGISASGPNAIGGTTGGRLGLVALKADLEQATDLALVPLLYWQAVARIYKRQTRWTHYLDLRMHSGRLLICPHEPSSPLAEAICVQRISTSLGWSPHDVCEEPA